MIFCKLNVVNFLSRFGMIALQKIPQNFLESFQTVTFQKIRDILKINFENFYFFLLCKRKMHLNMHCNDLSRSGQQPDSCSGLEG